MPPTLPKIDLSKVDRRSSLGNFLASKGVRDSAELRRISHLPRRDLNLALSELDPKLLAGLRPIQFLALQEIHRRNGGIVAIRVGGGKTLISGLVPTLLSSNAPVLIVPASLVEKTAREFRRYRDQGFYVDLGMQVVSYETLGRDKGQDLIDRYAPDLIIADECHKLKNLKAACTRRVKRYFDSNPGTRFVGLSGTITRASLKDFGHLLQWALGEHLTPLPTQWNTLQEWSLAVDNTIDYPLLPGALIELMDDSERGIIDTRVAARSAVRRRIADTEGVIQTSDKFEGSSLTLRPLKLPLSQYVQRLITEVIETWEISDLSLVFDSPIEVWRACRQLQWGFVYRWEELPPHEWRTARKKWGQCVRFILAHYGHTRQLDSELQAARECSLGHFDSVHAVKDGIPMHSQSVGEIWKEWQGIKETFDPNTVPAWIDHDMLDEFLAKLNKSKRKPILWVEFRSLGQRISELTGWPFFAEYGRDRTGRTLDSYTEAAPVIASIGSCGQGLNLQTWNDQIVLNIPQDGARLEQLLGRTHREGQTADEVNCDLVIADPDVALEYGNVEALRKAYKSATYIQHVTGQAQKLLYSDRIGVLSDLD